MVLDDPTSLHSSIACSKLQFKRKLGLFESRNEISDEHDGSFRDLLTNLEGGGILSVGLLGFVGP